MIIPSEFSDLPAEVRDDIAAKARSLAELSRSHCVHIFVRGTQPTMKINLASGFLVVLGDIKVLVTADHVVQEFDDIRQDDPSATFQAGDCPLRLDGRRMHRDAKLDIACMRVFDDELSRIGGVPYQANLQWPPPPPKEGDFIQFCGFPGYFRENLSPDDLSIAPYAGFIAIQSVGDGYACCVIDRATFIFEGPESHPPKGEVLGGLSGGPVLLKAQSSFPLIGLISQFQPSYEILRIALIPSPFPWIELA